MNKSRIEGRNSIEMKQEKIKGVHTLDTQKGKREGAESWRMPNEFMKETGIGIIYRM